MDFSLRPRIKKIHLTKKQMKDLMDFSLRPRIKKIHLTKKQVKDLEMMKKQIKNLESNNLMPICPLLESSPQKLPPKKPETATPITPLLPEMTTPTMMIQNFDMEIETESLSSKKSVINELEPGQEISMIPRWNGAFLLDDLDVPVETKEAAAENEEQEQSRELRPLRVSNSKSPHRQQHRQGR